MKRVLLCFLALSLLLSLTGCGGREETAPAEGKAAEPQMVDSASPLLSFEEATGLYRSLSEPLAAGDYVYTVFGESDGSAYTDQDGTLYRISLSGGEPEALGRLPEDLDESLSAAGPDGSLWFYSRSSPVLTRLDAEGRVSASYDLGALVPDFPTDLLVNTEGTVFLALFGAGQSLAALDLSGSGPRLLWQRELDGSFAQGLYSFALCAGGDPAALVNTETGSSLTVLDAADGHTLRELDLGGAVYSGLLNGSGDWDLWLRAPGQVFGCRLSDGSVTSVLDLSLAGLDPWAALCPLPDGSFAALGQDSDSSLALFRTAREPLGPDGALLTLALTGDSNELLQGLVLRWNREHSDIKVRLKDYSLYSTPAQPEGGSLRLLAELSAGEAPDLYEMSGLPAAFAGKDRFEDLGPWLEADREIDRSALRENILRAGRVGGELRLLIPRFALVTAGAAGSMEGRQGLSPADYEAIRAADPGLEQLFTQTYSRADLLRLLCCADLSSLADLEQGQAHFDGELFRGLLELCARQPAEPSEAYRPAEMLAQGRQLLDLNVCGTLSVEGAENSLARLGPDFCFPGLPCAEGCGSAVRPVLSLAMASASPHKEQAWQFLRQFLTGEAELGPAEASLSILRQQDLETKDRLLADASSAYDAGTLSAALDKILALAEQADRLYGEDGPLLDLVLELSQAYFAGDRSLADTVSDIQSRAQIYLSEQLD